MFGFDSDYQTLTTYIYMTFYCISHTAYLSTLVDVVHVSSIGHNPLSHSCVAYRAAAAAAVAASATTAAAAVVAAAGVINCV